MIAVSEARRIAQRAAPRRVPPRLRAFRMACIDAASEIRHGYRRRAEQHLRAARWTVHFAFYRRFPTLHEKYESRIDAVLRRAEREILS